MLWYNNGRPIRMNDRLACRAGSRLLRADRTRNFASGSPPAMRRLHSPSCVFCAFRGYSSQHAHAAAFRLLLSEPMGFDDAPIQ
jgi:hypothetical protein